MSRAKDVASSTALYDVYNPGHRPIRYWNLLFVTSAVTKFESHVPVKPRRPATQDLCFNNVNGGSLPEPTRFKSIHPTSETLGVQHDRI